MVPNIFKVNLYEAYTRMQVSMYDIFLSFQILELKEKLRYFEEGKLVRTVCQTSSVEMCR